VEGERRGAQVAHEKRETREDAPEREGCAGGEERLKGKKGGSRERLPIRQKTKKEGENLFLGDPLEKLPGSDCSKETTRIGRSCIREEER